MLFFFQSKLSKKSKFDLSDGEEDDFSAITRRDDFEDEMPLDDDDVDVNETESMYMCFAMRDPFPIFLGRLGGNQSVKFCFYLQSLN